MDTDELDVRSGARRLYAFHVGWLVDCAAVGFIALGTRSSMGGSGPGGSPS